MLYTKSAGEAKAKATPPRNSVAVTFFPTYAAQSKRQEQLSLTGLRDKIQNTTRASKEELPWLKLCVFGRRRTELNCLRSNANVEAVTGIELDYDQQQISFETAIATVRKAKLMCLAYTTANYKPEQPKWRLVLPLSRMIAPPRGAMNDTEWDKLMTAERGKLVARVNGLFGGVFDGASFTLSQAFYYGGIGDNPTHRAEVIAGEYIDLRADLDAGAIFKQREGTGRNPFEDYGSEQNLDWSRPVRNIIEGVELHDSIRDLAASMIGSGVSAPAATVMLRAVMQASSLRRDDERWKARYNDIERTVDSAVERYGQTDDVPFQQNDAGFFDPWAQFVVPDFPVQILPPIVRDFVEAQSRVIGVDRSSMAMSALGAISGAIPRSIKLKMLRHGDWFVSACIWVLLYGDSSKKKTAAFNAAVKALEDCQKETQEAYRFACAAAEKGEEPDPPPRWVASDTSIEKLAEILTRSDRGLLFKKDEIAGWIGQMEKYGGSSRGASADRAFWVEARDGGSYPVDRINRGEIFVNNLSVTMMGGIRPKRLAELKGLTSDGLLQRFLPNVMGATKLPQDVPCDNAPFHNLLRRLIEHDPRTIFIVSDDALCIMEKLRVYLFDLEQNAGGLAEGFQSFVGKLGGVAGNLALILHIAGEHERNAFEEYGDSGVIEKVTAENVDSLIRDCILPHALEFYSGVEGATNGDRLAQLASWILTNAKERFVASDLTSDVASYRGLSLFEINERVSPLVAANWIKPKEKGRHCRAWDVNPDVFKQFAARSKQEEAAKQKIARLMHSARRPRGG
jgi:Protein of unknown function (DUF3987)